MAETAAVLGRRELAEHGPEPTDRDNELVVAVRAGDTSAFEEIYDRYARGILAFCLHMLGSREAAEDALQLTFVSAYRALQSGESSIALRPWLYTIARNRCLSELRARREAASLDELVYDQPAIDGLADQVQRREDLREMLDDMRRLPPDQRAALVLFELGDHPQKDIATVLGVHTEKVKALVFQAREALVRGRAARAHSCRDIREQLATLPGRVPARSVLRAHIERCPGCQSFEHEVRHQRAAFALILPVALTGELKSWILGSALHGSGAVAVGVGACGSGGGAVAAGAGACGGGAVAGSATAAGGMGGTAGFSAAAGGLAGTGTGGAAVAAGAPVVAAATGLAAVGESVGVGGLGATGVVAKILTAAAIATVAATSSHGGKPIPPLRSAPAPIHNSLLASTAAHVAPKAAPSATGVSSTTTSTRIGRPGAGSSTTPAPTSGGASPSSGGASGSTTGTSNPTGAGALTAQSGGNASATAVGTAPSAVGTSSGSGASADPGGATTTPSASSSASDAAGAASSGSAASTPSPTAPTSTAGTTTAAPPVSTGTAATAGATPPPTTSSATSGGSTGASTGKSNKKSPPAAPVTVPATAPVVSPTSAPATSTTAVPPTTAAGPPGHARGHGRSDDAQES